MRLVSATAPTTLAADEANHALTIQGSNFLSSNVVQFKWGVGSGAGVWNTGNTATYNGPGQLTVSMNPGRMTDVIYVRVCRAAAQPAHADCSAGTQVVTVTRREPDAFDHP